MNQKSPIKTAVKISTLLAISAALLTRASASSLLFDFGPTVATGSDTLLDPAHWVGSVPASETAWNTINSSVGGTFSSLLFSDNSSAGGVSLTLGNSPANNTVINFASMTGYSSAALGSASANPPINTGVYAGTSPVKDGVFTTTTGTGANPGAALGLRIDGLEAGSYTLFFAGRNTSTGAPAAERVFGAAGASQGTFDFSSALNSLSLNNSNANNAAFVLGDNYNTLTISISSGDSLYVAVQASPTSNPTGLGETRAFLNTLEIAPVPEPGTGSLIVFGLLGFALNRRTRLALLRIS